MDAMNLIGMICLWTGLSIYIASVIYLSKLKQFFWGLILPTFMALVAGYQLDYGYMESYSRIDGVLFTCLFILAVFGYILYVVVRYGKVEN